MYKRNEGKGYDQETRYKVMKTSMLQKHFWRNSLKLGDMFAYTTQSITANLVLY